MSLAVPLQVLIGERAITAELLDDISYGNAAPGGYTTASVKLSRPIHLPNPQLEAYQPVTIIDTRSGEQVWWGRLEAPGRSSEEVWSLGAVGGSSHTRDEFAPVVYNDSRGSSFVRREEKVMPNSTFGAGTEGASTPLVFTWPDGTVLPASGRTVAFYPLLRDTGQHLGGLHTQFTGGRTLSTILQQIVGRDGPAGDANLASVAISTSLQTLAARLGTEFATLHAGAELRLFWNGAAGTAIVGDTTWTECVGTRVLGTRLSRLGVELTAAANYTSPVIPVASIVEDLLGRYLPEYDRAGARVDTSSPVTVSQMAYEDGTTAAQILDDLMGLAPTHFWAAWGNNSGLGPTFEWTPWPLEVALPGLDTRRDGFDSPGSAADLYNQVTVRYKDPNGNTRTLLRTASVPALDAAGLTRCGSLDLGSQVGDVLQAATAGDAFLAAHKYPSNSGTIKVSRPVVDMSSGRTLYPHQLRAGVLCRVGNLQPQADALNPVPDGSTTFRVSAVGYSAKANTATLTLDSYERTLARSLAKLGKATSLQRRI
jgi:hypothetical protein